MSISIETMTPFTSMSTIQIPVLSTMRVESIDSFMCVIDDFNDDMVPDINLKDRVINSFK